MFAARYVPGNKSLVVKDIEIPEPGSDEVLLKVKAAGMCHSDIFMLDAQQLDHEFTMGHETCGSVVKKGSHVSAEYDSEDLYAIHGPNPCGECDICESGNDNLCQNPERTFVGLGEDGGYAEYVKVRARSIVKVPKGVAPETAAVATDAVLTPYHAVKTVGEVKKGSNVLIIGLGGLGLNALQIAIALGANVTACDVKESSLEKARGFKPHKVLNSKDLDQELKEREFDVIFDIVGIDATFSQAQRLVKPAGTIVLIGVGNGQVNLRADTFITFQTRVLGTFWGTHAELEAVYELIKDGKVVPNVKTAPLKDVADWLEKFREGKVHSRMAFIP